MKNLTSIFFVLLLCLSACQSSKNLVNIQPLAGSLEVPAKGNLDVWANVSHPAFEVVVFNKNSNQSCELYSVKADGTEKWVSPSLVANSQLTVKIPANGHLRIKNFNPNALTVSYKITE